MKKKKNIRLNTMQILAVGFLAIILIGGLLLWLPACNQKPIAFLDALFTSTTAVCVTGLATIVPATQFTLLGQIVLLILIQIGGLGVIACATAFFLMLKRKITVKERVIIQETYGMDKLGGMVVLVLRILKGTFLVEGIGACLFAIQFVPEYGVLKGIWYSVFHSVSAFCNAGIDILGDSSFVKYVHNPIINVTTMLLIVLSGLGFLVWRDLLKNAKKIYRKEMPITSWFGKLELHSKIVITTTTFLLIAGTLNFFFVEFSNPETMEGMTLGQRIMASAFQSVTTRTAGFATISQNGLMTESKMISCLLMFIGGSPGGTAGGIKTTTAAMLALTTLTVIRGGKDTECFGRKISYQNFRTGFAVVIVASIILFAGTAVITLLEPDVAFQRVLYETTSAVGTVGLTADLTHDLGTASRIVIMFLMYVGRLGPITLALVFGGKVHPRDSIRELPERRIFVG